MEFGVRDMKVWVVDSPGLFILITFCISDAGLSGFGIIAV